MTNSQHPRILQTKKKISWSSLDLLSSSLYCFNCCCTSVIRDCKRPFYPNIILDYNRKHFHSIVISCVCGHSTVRQCVIFEHLHFVFNRGRCIYRVKDSLSLSAHLKICELFQNKGIFF